MKERRGSDIDERNKKKKDRREIWKRKREREREKKEKETNPTIRLYNVQTRRNSSLFLLLSDMYLAFFSFLAALLSFLTPERKSKYGRDNNNKKKRKERRK